jgi:hypothetical protein
MEGKIRTSNLNLHARKKREATTVDIAFSDDDVHPEAQPSLSVPCV